MNSPAELFARGFALTTASHPVGLTPRALRAVATLTESTPSPEPTPSLILGQLEGIWAVIYDRRAAIEAKHAGAFKDILKAIAALDWDAIVSAVNTQTLIDPDISAEMLASEIRTRIVNMITGDLPADSRAAWHDVLLAAVTDGTAEGQTAALALLDQAKGAGIDWELTAKQAKEALSSGQVLSDSADSWIAKQTQGLAYQIGRKLARLWEEKASRSDMVSAIQDILNSDTNVANLVLDSAIGQSLSQGSLATYALGNTAYADFVTAGDSRVCLICASAESGGPYLLYQCPAPPLHINCRCTVAPSDKYQLSLSNS